MERLSCELELKTPRRRWNDYSEKCVEASREEKEKNFQLSSYTYGLFDIYTDKMEYQNAIQFIRESLHITTLIIENSVIIRDDEWFFWCMCMTVLTKSIH